VTNVRSVGKPALGGPFVLYDQDGKGVTDASFKNQFTLLYFGFTHCPDICPSELVKVGKVIKELEMKKTLPLKPVYISVDPARDTISQLKHYSQDFHPSFSFLTGTRDQIERATRAYRVYFSKVDQNDDVDEDYLVDHSIVLYLLDPDGEFVEFYTQSMQVSDIVQSIAKHMKEDTAKRAGGK
ncbi:Sco1, partial [Symbiodinium microadriaticum]